MTWKYQQHDGALFHNGEFEGTGYSGTEYGRNNPTAQDVANLGPIPQGNYWIGKPFTDAVRGPIVMALTPNPEDQMFGRSGFLIHGDNAAHDASHGCVVLGPLLRAAIANSGDVHLLVTA